MLTNAEISMLGLGLWETIYMTVMSTLFAYIIGLPMGVLLVTSDKDNILPMPKTNKILNVVVNLVRSVPFIILLVAVIPFTRLVVGKSYGCNATIVPLVIAAAPFVARLVESSLREIDKGMIEASLSMGAGPLQIVRKVLVPEAKPSLILGAAIATTTILGYSAMAGFVGGGGLGTIAINNGYYRYQTGIMLITVVLLVVVVQIFQEFGDRLAARSDKRK